MKRTLVLALVGVMAFSVVTLGGFKFGAEQGVDTVGAGSYPLSTYVGWDFDAPYIETGPVSIAGDFVLTRSYDWVASVLSGELGFNGELVFSYVDDVDVVFRNATNIDYAGLPNDIDLIDLDFGVDVIGYVTDVLTLSAGVNFVYGDIDPRPQPRFVDYGFNTSFYFGFDAEW